MKLEEKVNKKIKNIKMILRDVYEEQRKIRKEIEKLTNKLAEYEQLEEQGLLLRLPCKIGDTVYKVLQDCDDECIVDYECMVFDCEHCNYLCSYFIRTTFDIFMLNEIGKTIFLTREEAEQALEKMEKEV